jgi:hypothetical protein
MELPPLFWVTSGQASRIRRTHTKNQIEATKRRRFIERRIEDVKLAKKLGITVEELDF